MTIDKLAGFLIIIYFTYYLFIVIKGNKDLEGISKMATISGLTVVFFAYWLGILLICGVIKLSMIF